MSRHLKNESEIQQAWQRLPQGIELILPNGLLLKVLFPGWLNPGKGPDFKQARLILDKEELFGDIEIHKEESDWFHHGHHTDPAYNSVILHVYLASSGRNAVNQLGRKIPALAFIEPVHLLSELDSTSGPCAVKLAGMNPGKIASFIFQASEKRLTRKAGDILTIIESGVDEEQILYRLILSALGAPGNSSVFCELSNILSIEKIHQILQNYSLIESRNLILSSWLKPIGAFNQVNPDKLLDSVRRDWQIMADLSKQLPVLKEIKSIASRPHNSPIRVFIAFFYHIEACFHQGLLKSWLQWILKNGETSNRALAVNQLKEMFPENSWDPFFKIWSAETAKKTTHKSGIGESILKKLLINAVLPFFLAKSLQTGNKNLERSVFNLWMLLPPEASNHKTRFMEKRMQLQKNRVKAKNIAYSQGLLHLYDSCCTHYEEGCQNCSIMRYLP